ncbi:MAG: transporter related [Thermoleophilia bacterium]|nr:transporter related [Thermoleophilia bacterium]
MLTRMSRATDRPEPDGGWKSFRRLLTFFRPFKRQLAISVATGIAISLLATRIPFLIGQAVNILKDRDFAEMDSVVKELLVVAVAMAALGASRRIAAGFMSLGMEQTIRERLFSHLTGLGFRFFDKQQTGQLLSRVTSDVSQVRFFLGYGLTYSFMHLAKLVTVPILLFNIDYVLGSVVLFVMPIIVFVSVRFSRRAHPVMREAQQRLAFVTAHGEETIVGARVVRSFGQEEREVARFRRLTDDVVDREREVMRIEGKFKPLYGLIPNLTLATLIIVGARRIDSGAINAGDFVAFFFLVLIITGPLRIIGNLLNRAQRATASSDRLFELLDADDRIPQLDSPTPMPERTDQGSSLSFEGVTFGYRDGRPVIDDLSLEVPRGQTVALIGATGCGKTTLASLVPRFYDPEQGTVRIDGVDLRELSLHELRRSIGIVDQEPFLFSATIAENLRFGNPDATDEQVWAAIDSAQAREFVDRLPNGIETIVGERGLTLSGGQRQRLAIARALVVDPRVLILDDATASVDSQVEERISTALSGDTGRRTTIIIAHRPSTIALADHIVVMGHGTIEDQGTHDELIQRNPTYQLVHEQRAARREFLLDEQAEGDASEKTGGLA